MGAGGKFDLVGAPGPHKPGRGGRGRFRQRFRLFEDRHNAALWLLGWGVPAACLSAVAVFLRLDGTGLLFDNGSARLAGCRLLCTSALKSHSNASNLSLGLIAVISLLPLSRKKSRLRKRTISPPASPMLAYA